MNDDLAALVEQITLQLEYLNGEHGEYEYTALEVYLQGISGCKPVVAGDPVA